MKVTPDTNVETWYDECKDIVNDPDRAERMIQMKKENKFYFNAQWESEESDDLDATGQVDIVLNVTRRAFRTLISLMVGPQPTAKFMPRDVLPSNQQDAQFQQQQQLTLSSLQGLWNHCWYISGGTAKVLRRAVQCQVVMGLGYIHTEIDPQADYYRGEVVFKARLPWEMVVPLNASELDFSDAHKQYYRVMIPITEAIRKIGEENKDAIAKLRQDAHLVKDTVDYDVEMLSPDQEEVHTSKLPKIGSATVVSDDALVVDWVEMEERISRPAKMIKLGVPGGFVDTMVYIPEGDEDVGDFDHEKYLRNADIEYDTAEPVDIHIPRIKKTTFVGRSLRVGEPEVLPISAFSTVPLVDEDTYNPLSVGESFFVKSIQKLLNKVFSLAVLHLQTSGSGDRLVGFKGAFGDTPQSTENFQKHYAMPFSATELATEYQEGMNINTMFQRIQATPLQPAAVEVLRLCSSWINQVTGVDPQSYGMTQGSIPRTLGQSISIREWGDENARIPIINMSYALQKLGEVWMELALSHYTFPKSFSVPDHNQELQNYVINQPNGDMILNNLEGLRANVFITSGSTLMLNRYSMLMIFKELMPLSPVFVKMFLLYSDIPDKFDLIKEMDHTAQLEQQLEQLIPQFQQMQQLIEGKDEEITALKEKIDLTKLRGALKMIETKFREYLKFKMQTIDLVQREQRGGES